MANGFNGLLTNNTRWVIDNLALTTAPTNVMPPPVGGSQPFDVQTATLHLTNAAGIGVNAGFPVNDALLLGYWVPQGQSIVVPIVPMGRRFVFTPDFSGCSFVVDQLDAFNYRVYHISGGAHNLGPEYAPLAGPGVHGLGLAAAMTFEDYGSGGGANPRGFAFLKYEGGRWWIYYQRPQGAPIGFVGGNLMANGPQTILGGGRMPVANLLNEAPRLPGRHDGLELPPAPRFTGAARQMLPNDESW